MHNLWWVLLKFLSLKLFQVRMVTNGKTLFTTKSDLSWKMTLIDKPSNEKVIGCRTVLRNKYKTNGELDRRKVRVVAKGFTQRPGVDFHDTFALVARLSSLRTLTISNGRRKRDANRADCHRNNLFEWYDGYVYMEKPKLLQQMLKKIVASDSSLVKKAKKMLSTLKQGGKVCKLNKALYGFRQTRRRWYARLDSILKKLDLAPTSIDPCVYHDKNNHIFVLTYVDDILIAYRDKVAITQLKEEFSKNFEIRDLGNARYCLGIEISRSREGICLFQAGYIRDILDRFGMVDCKPVRTPLESGIKLHDTTDD